ncbi:MAG TPA: hotdog domain-containing protein, partial [Noviherbaspirillum sp.]
PGLHWTRRFDVTPDKAIGFMGEKLRVYASPSMVRDIEINCREKLEEFLGEYESSVGIHIDLDHLRPTLVGMWVDMRASVAAVEGRKLSFEIEVRDAIEVVGRARHERFVVDLRKQKAALDLKAMRVSLLGSE